MSQHNRFKFLPKRYQERYEQESMMPTVSNSVHNLSNEAIITDLKREFARERQNLEQLILDQNR